MDEYISKPIDVNSFLHTVEAYGPLLDVRPERETGGGGLALEEDRVGEDRRLLYDRSATLRRLGGDESLFRDMIGFFMEDVPELIEQLRRGLLSDDARAVERAAHSLKGLAANCGAGPSAEAAERVERIARDGRLPEAAQAVELLVSELEALRVALSDDELVKQAPL